MSGRGDYTSTLKALKGRWRWATAPWSRSTQRRKPVRTSAVFQSPTTNR